MNGSPAGAGGKRTTRRRPLHYVNEYLTRYCYGGPEGGGWSYEGGTFVRCHGEYSAVEDAGAKVASLAAYCDAKNQGKVGTWSPDCTGYTVIRTENHEGRDYPLMRPRWRREAMAWMNGGTAQPRRADAAPRSDEE